MKKGFTLIEILIVVAIIGILASVVLVGLGPVQRQGRDARRISDLRQVQTGLELFFNKNGYYPNAASWTDVTNALVSSGLVSNVPKDPRPAQSYEYGTNGTNGNSYVLKATLEDAGNPNFSDDIDDVVYGVDCNDANQAYCVRL